MKTLSILFATATLVFVFITLISCGSGDDRLQKKAQSLIVQKCSKHYSSPEFEFGYGLKEYEKNGEKIYELRYIGTFEGYPLVFVATFDKEVEVLVSNTLFENSLYDAGLLEVNLDSVIILADNDK